MWWAKTGIVCLIVKHRFDKSIFIHLQKMFRVKSFLSILIHRDLPKRQILETEGQSILYLWHKIMWEWTQKNLTWSDCSYTKQALSHFTWLSVLKRISTSFAFCVCWKSITHISWHWKQNIQFKSPEPC